MLILLGNIVIIQKKQVIVEKETVKNMVNWGYFLIQ